MAAGVECANQGTHAGSGEAVDGNVVLLKPLKNADVGQSQRASSFQRQADGGAAGGLDRGQRDMGGVWRSLVCGRTGYPGWTLFLAVSSHREGSDG